jgi:hypothetical protein
MLAFSARRSRVARKSTVKPGLRGRKAGPLMALRRIGDD